MAKRAALCLRVYAFSSLVDEMRLTPDPFPERKGSGVRKPCGENA